MKKILLLLALLLATATAHALPFVTTPSTSTYPIHWYQLKINDKYVYYDPDGDIFNQIQLTPTASSENNFLWCFVQTSSDKILIYNRAAQQYLEEAGFVTSDMNSSYISYVVERASGGFYIKYYHQGDGRYYYLYEAIGDDYDVLSAASSPLSSSAFNVIEVLVEGDIVPVTELAFTPYDAYTPNNVQTDTAENYLKLFDKNKNTKWCVDNSTGSWETIWVDFKSNVPFIPMGYTMTTASDTYSWQGRNPKKWKIYAKAHENDDWTTIVDVTDGAATGLGTANTTDYNFTIDGVNTPYQYFRFEVSEVCGKGGWQNNHYVFQLAELELTGESTSIPEDPLPFVATPSLMSYPIHWYQLKINDKYVYYNPDATYKVSLTSTESTDDAYLWCFEELAPDSIVIYNKSKKEYIRMGNSLIWTPTASMINYAEAGDETGFYVYYYDGNTKCYHLEQPGYDVLAQTQRKDLAQLFNAVEVQVEEDHGEIKEARLIPTAAYTPNNANTNENEDYRKLFDIDKSSKWCVDNSTGSWETIWADFKSKEPFIPTSYTLTTASDTYSWQGRNPKKWKIYAKANETDDWTTIVDVTDGDAAGLGFNNMTNYSFPIDGLSKKYQYFRFEVSEVRGKGGWQNNHYVFQLAELFMSGYTLSTTVSGDANSDNKVDVNDVTAVINYILGKNPTPFNVNNANVNGDAKIDVLDMTLIINIILGIN